MYSKCSYREIEQRRQKEREGDLSSKIHSPDDFNIWVGHTEARIQKLHPDLPYMVIGAQVLGLSFTAFADTQAMCRSDSEVE